MVVPGNFSIIERDVTNPSDTTGVVLNGRLRVAGWHGNLRSICPDADWQWWSEYEI